MAVGEFEAYYVVDQNEHTISILYGWYEAAKQFSEQHPGSQLRGWGRLITCEDQMKLDSNINYVELRNQLGF